MTVHVCKRLTNANDNDNVIISRPGHLIHVITVKGTGVVKFYRKNTVLDADELYTLTAGTDNHRDLYLKFEKLRVVIPTGTEVNIIYT